MLLKGCFFVVQTLSNHIIQSPEVTSKDAQNDELNDGAKTISDKLSEALLNIREKEDLVKQHAKVAEEAVSGIVSVWVYVRVIVCVYVY